MSRLSRRSLTFLFILVFFAFSFSGCQYSAAKKEIANADKLVSDLKGAGGEKRVPYEYTSAEKFLEVSKIEFDGNDFKNAKGFAERSKSSAEAGLAEIKKK